MPATKITDLLPIPEGTRQPHAYQVFGLEDGEQDVRKIADAVKLTITRLKASKESTDAKLWAKAAKLAQDARVVLADPAKKSQLDARFGIISIEDEPQPAEQPADPLAGVLPTTDPLAAVLPPTNPIAPVAAVAPAPEPGSPASAPQVPSTENSDASGCVRDARDGCERRWSRIRRTRCAGDRQTRKETTSQVLPTDNASASSLYAGDVSVDRRTDLLPWFGVQENWPSRSRTAS